MSRKKPQVTKRVKAGKEIPPPIAMDKSTMLNAIFYTGPGSFKKTILSKFMAKYDKTMAIVLLTFSIFWAIYSWHTGSFAKLLLIPLFNFLFLYNNFVVNFFKRAWWRLKINYLQRDFYEQRREFYVKYNKSLIYWFFYATGHQLAKPYTFEKGSIIIWAENGSQANKKFKRLRKKDSSLTPKEYIKL